MIDQWQRVEDEEMIEEMKEQTVEDSVIGE